MFRTEVCETLQALLLSISKPEPEIFVVITIEKFVRDRLLVISSVCHNARHASKIFVSYFAQALGDGLYIRDFGPDQPERVNKRKPCNFLPLPTKIPKLKCIGVALPEPNRLVADNEARRATTLRSPNQRWSNEGSIQALREDNATD